MFKLKVLGATNRKMAINSLSTVALLKYFNNIEVGRPKVDVIHLFNGSYILQQTKN